MVALSFDCVYLNTPPSSFSPYFLPLSLSSSPFLSFPFHLPLPSHSLSSCRFWSPLPPQATVSPERTITKAIVHQLHRNVASYSETPPRWKNLPLPKTFLENSSWTYQRLTFALSQHNSKVIPKEQGMYYIYSSFTHHLVCLEYCDKLWYSYLLLVHILCILYLLEHGWISPKLARWKVDFLSVNTCGIPR